MPIYILLYEAVSDQGPVWVQSKPNFQGSWKAFLNGHWCSNFYNMMYWERILQKNHLITCFRRFYQRPNHLAQYIPILGWVDVGKFIKVANIHSGFYVCYTKGCPPFKKVQFFWTLFKRPLTPPPFIWTFVLFCRGCFLNAFLSIWYNVPILPPNFTINASKVPFHANFMLLNDLQNTRQFPT